MLEAYALQQFWNRSIPALFLLIMDHFLLSSNQSPTSMVYDPSWHWSTSPTWQDFCLIDVLAYRTDLFGLNGKPFPSEKNSYSLSLSDGAPVFPRKFPKRRSRKFCKFISAGVKDIPSAELNVVPFQRHFTKLHLS